MKQGRKYIVMNKKVVKKLLAMGLSVSLLVSGVAVGNYASAAKKLNVSVKKITLYVGKKKTIKANMSAKFSVSNKKIVSLKNVKKKQCTVVAKKKGSCTITVKAKEHVKKIKVTVKKKVTPVKTKAPTMTPTVEPIAVPTITPVTTISPTAVATTGPGITEETTAAPSVEPTAQETMAPTEVAKPTVTPVETVVPTSAPEPNATENPTVIPEVIATVEPNQTPEGRPATVVPTASSTIVPTTEPVQLQELSVEERVNYFGFQMLDQLNEDNNVTISPYSIMTAMTMLDNAADGGTKAEIEKALGISDLDKWNEEFSAYDKQYLNQDETNDVSFLRSVNSIWKNDTNFSFDSEIQKNYLDKMLTMYGAINESMDFENGNPKEQINNWVNEQTKEMIPGLIEEPIDQDMESLLVNAVCFSGKWETKFAKSRTGKANFYGKEETTSVDMMHHSIKSFKYLQEGSLSVAEFPFSDGNLVMDVVLAQDDASTIEEFQKLSNQEKVALFKKAGESNTTTMNVSLPKFKISYGTKDLTEQLKQMGVTATFDRDKAELPGLRGENEEQIYVKDVLHQSVIEVAEGGVKASASTAVEVISTAAPRVEVEFNVNKPFVYVIRDKNTNMIYFVGEVEDLTEKNAIEDNSQSSDELIYESMSPTYPPYYMY